jgi:HemK-related putative methylase
MYEPREDSYLLQKFVKKYARGLVLDVGTGSGIQAVAAAGKPGVEKVLAVDIDRKVILQNQKAIDNKKIVFRASDLFSNVKQGFDTIIFNPPYLPSVKVRDITVDGGRKGYEVIERFLQDASEHLEPEGSILLLFSSLTKKDKVDEIISDCAFVPELLEEKYLGGFETLYVYQLKKSSLLKWLEKNGISGINKFMKGHRGVIYTGIYNRRKVAVKVQRKDIGVEGTVDREANILKKLNRKGIGPKVILTAPDLIVYEFVKGDFIEKFIEKSPKYKIKEVLAEVFRQCFVLDKMKLNKEEMHNPYKHVIIDIHPVMVDFERCKPTVDPKNVTQFCQYLMLLKPVLDKKGFKIDRERLMNLAREYKKRMTEKNFQEILGILA